MDKKKVLLGMSGGVDSSVAAILLKEKGYDVFGITLNLWENESKDGGCGNNQATIDAKKVCNELGIPHYTVEYKKEFKEHVIDDFASKYKECKTPNPCIECNRYLKFNVMYEKAKELGIDYIATGHYALTKYSEECGRYVIAKSKSAKKDQSYVLYNIPKEIVEKIIFPLGEYETKEEIREKAKEYDLNVSSKPDSQEICFIPDNDYINFLENKCNISSREGDIVNTEGEVLGKHSGLHRYTIGQRKGIHTKGNDKLYVIKLDKEKNQLIVGAEEKLFSSGLYAKDINLILIDEITKPLKVNAKIRYQAKEAAATIYPIEYGIMKVEFEKKQRAITPGQSVVFYIDDYLIRWRKDRRSYMKKEEIRRQIEEQRKNLSKDFIAENSQIISGKLFCMDIYDKTDYIYIYMDFKKEVSTREIIRDALSKGKKVAIPKIINNKMDFYYINNIKDVNIGYYGIQEPVSNRKAKVENPLMIMPGVAFDRKKHRIGYGARLL